MEFSHGYALLIGVDQYSVAAWALPAIARDVQALKEALEHPQRCAYPPGQVKALLGAAATRDGILAGLTWLQKQINHDAQATAVIYFSGHGWRDEEVEPPAYFFVPYDAQENRLRYTALRASDFAAEVRKMKPARLLALLDCCHAGGMGVKGEGENSAELFSAAIPASVLSGEGKSLAYAGGKGLAALAEGSGRAVISSSQGGQKSYLRRDGRMSIFTYHLIEALTGHAEPKEGAKEVLTTDIVSHVYRRVSESALADHGKAQQPDCQISRVFPVALLLGGEGLAKGVRPPDPLENLHGLMKGAGDLVIGSKQEINTGRAPYFGQFRGNYVGGDQTIHYENRSVDIHAPVDNSVIITGNNNQVRSWVDDNSAPTLERFLELLHALQDGLPQAGLPPEEQAEVQEDLQRAAQLAAKPTPNRNLMLKRLDSAVNFLANAATIAVSAPQLIEWGRKLVEWAGKLF